MGATIGSGIGAVAMADPEPISKAILTITGVVTSLIGGGCGATCTDATAIRNSYMTAVNAVKNAYWAQPVRTKALQTAALSAIAQLIQWGLQNCNNPALQAAGQACAQDFIRGGHPLGETWCTAANGYSAATGYPQGCDSWATDYDAIAKDPAVVPDNGAPVTPEVAASVFVQGAAAQQQQQGAVQQAEQTTGGIIPPDLLFGVPKTYIIAGLVLLVILIKL